ncbi:PRLI-interacting factor A [Striga asiatica]|uniref:PRLI-interacting factor A n=1 Tax=Striga asiatica TaxID=4170 RepID=A0A5A7REH8_STRAF|nr:PRLI-interacting factor A [Striga asiatica]
MNEQAPMMNQQQQHLMSLNPNMMSMNQMSQQPQPQMVPPMSRGYGGVWPQPMQFQNPNPNPGAMKPPVPSFKKPLGPRNNWKGKKVNKPNDKRRNNGQLKSVMAGSSSGGPAGVVNITGNMNFNSYQPPTLNELQHQNRLKTHKFFPKKKFNKNNTNRNTNTNTNTNTNMNMGGGYNNFNNSRAAPYAPRNTTSFIIRAKKSGGIASLVSPSPVTPAVLPTPIFSPSREVLVDMAKEEWGVDGYGSMKGLIRLRSPGHEMEAHDEDEEDDGDSSDSDVEEHVEVERRLDQDLSRFEMLYNPNSAVAGGMDFHSVLENRVDDQDSHIAQLEEENLILKERLFLMERELGDLRRRMQLLERRGNRVGEIINEEVVENVSENESGSLGEEGGHSVEDNNEDFSENNMRDAKGKFGDGMYAEVETVEKNEELGFQKGVQKEFDMIGVDGKGSRKVSDSEDKGENNKDDEYVDVKNKNGDVFDLGKEVENKDDVVGEADENSKVAKTEGKDENHNDESVDADKVERNNMVVKDGDENNNHEVNKCVDMEVTVMANIDTESSEPVVAGGNICMEEQRVTEGATTVFSSDVAN